MNRKPLFIILLFFTLCFVERVAAQQYNVTLNRDFLSGFDNYYNNKELNFQTFVKPYRFSDIKNITDSTADFPRLLKGTKAEEYDKKRKSIIEISPLLVSQVGYELGDKSHLTNELAIGGKLFMYLGNKFALSFKAMGGKIVAPSFTDSIIKTSHIVPGRGYAYLSKYDSAYSTYAYQYFSGYLSYSPNKIFNVQVGQDKQFWGDGYRSLFLSDVSAPYPFLKITTNVWHLTYVNLYTIMKDVTNPSGLKKDWLNKYATFHYLGWNATKRINIGLFESIVWQGSDSTRYRGYDVNYLNPVMFFRPTEYSVGSSDNSFVGMSFKIKAFKKQQVYGQLLLDEFLLKEIKADVKYFIKKDSAMKWGWWANKYAFQLGFKSFDLFKIKRLNFQTEYNYVRPYTYSHGSVQQNYGNSNEALAHPLGANFYESSTFLNYRYNRLFLEAKLVYAVYGADKYGSDYGNNIFISYTDRQREYGNFTGQGYQTKLTTISVRGAYMLDTRMNMKIELGLADRMMKSDAASSNTPWIFIGLKTDLCNLYDDY